MDEVALRELRNHTSDVLHRVEAGEELTVTVSGRPVARLVPLPRRPQFLPWQRVLAHRAEVGVLAAPVATPDDDYDGTPGLDIIKL